MYGTIFRLRPQSGREQDVEAHFRKWNDDLGPKVQGARAAYLLRSERNPGELVAVAVFEDEDSYRANASNPDQDAWYRGLRDLLDSEPEWEDGEYLVAESLESRSRSG